VNEPKIDGVSLHEHLEALARAERQAIDMRFELEKELVRQEFDKIEQATKLQAVEYERRLDVLNHAHAEAQRVLATYVPREAYESYVHEQSRAEELRVKEEEAKAELLRQSVGQTQKELTATSDRLQRDITKISERVSGLEAGDSVGARANTFIIGAAALGITIVVILINIITSH
jgi:hypothetical protein